MINAIYLILVLGVGMVSLAVGFRRGISRQLASILGFAFGAVASRVLSPEWADSFQWARAFSMAPEFGEFTSNLVCGVTVYTVVYLLFSLLSPVLQAAMSVFRVGIFNRLSGAFFTLLKNLLWLSIGFNLLLCFSPKSELLRYEAANDGNLVAAVMSLTHAVLGCSGAEEFAHFHQLKEAKSISGNFNRSPNVILTQPGEDVPSGYKG